MTRTAKRSEHLLAGKPAKPEELSPAAAKEWDRMVFEVGAAGIQLTSAHRAALQLAATIAADIVEAAIVIRADGAYIQTKAGLVQHPAAKRLDALRRDYVKVLTMLGVRQAVASPDTSREESLEELLSE